jgi:SulP family sulfate permease
MSKPYKKYIFNRSEFAGSLGDLGTLLPLANRHDCNKRIDPTGLFFVVGVFYILSGVYYGVTVPVRPMKVIGAYSMAMGLNADVITSSALIMGIFMLFIGVTGAVRIIGEYTSVSVVRGIQLSVDVLLMVQGIKFMLGTSTFQAYLSEPHLAIQSIGPVPISVVLGVIFAVITFLLIENKRVPGCTCSSYRWNAGGNMKDSKI